MLGTWDTKVISGETSSARGGVMEKILKYAHQLTYFQKTIKGFVKSVKLITSEICIS